MAVIGTIRKHSALAVILVGVAITAFILSDLFTGQGRRAVPPVGVIDGNEISYADYTNRVDEALEIQAANMGVENVTPEQAFEVRNTVWNEFLEKVIMGEEYDKLGLVVTEEELFDQVQGPNPHELILQYFKDPNTNQYNPALVLQFLQNLDNMKPEQKAQWIQLEQYIKKDRLSQKYKNLVSKSYYIPQAFAQMDYDSKQRTAEVSYVAVKYSNIPDSDVKVTDEDYEAYYEKNKQQYLQDPSRDIDYVIFEIKPSAEDMIRSEKDFRDLYSEFLTTTDVGSFVNAVSDNRYDSAYFKQGELPLAIDSIMFNSPVGTFVPPYIEDNAYHAAKLIDVQNRPDSMKADHILIAYQGAFRASEEIKRSKEEAQKMADSLYNILKKAPDLIGMMAQKHSDDPSKEENKGDLGWFADGSMVGPFNEAVYNGKVGDITMAETQFGFHIIRITGKLEPVKKVRVARIDRAIEPSSKTAQDIYTQASIFAGESNSIEKFEKTVTDQGINKRSATYLREMQNAIPGITNAREIVRWAFAETTEVGNISPVFDIGESYVVAVLKVAREEGITPLEQLKPNISVLVLNEKKAEKIMQQIGNVSDLNQVASSFGTVVESNKSLTFSSRNIPGFGSEPEVIGTIFTLEPGKISPPLKGNGAVFIARVERFVDPQPATNLDINKAQLTMGFQSRVSNNSMFTALQEKAEIEDNRLLFY